MTKQEFLAFSLPYGLKCKELGLNEIFTLNPKLYSLIELLNWSNVYQPLLRPLSDLNKPIEHKGEKFVPIKKLREIIGGGWCSVYEGVVELIQEWDIDTLKDKIKYLPFEFIQLFISWHFDLITEECEKVYVTETNNPY